MALPDIACVVFRIAYGKYAQLYEQTFGRSVYSINFPRHTDQMCDHEGTTVALSARIEPSSRRNPIA